MSKTEKLIILCGIFVVSIVTANIASVKIMVLGPWVIDAGTIVYPITFLVTDTVSEVYGKRTAYQVVITGFICTILAMIILTLARVAPPAVFWQGQEAFNQVIGTVPRLVIASLITFLVSQTHDIWAFHFWKRITKGRHLWLRNNLSTIASQAIDTGLFTTLAFAGTVAGLELLSMMISVYIFKVVFALLDTPFCYWLVGWCNSETDLKEHP